MTPIRIIHTGPKPLSTRWLLLELARRLIRAIDHYVTATYFYVRHKLSHNAIGLLALALATFGAFRAERVLPGGELYARPHLCVDPLPQTVPTLEEATFASTKVTKPAKYRNRAGQLPKGYDVYGTVVFHLIAHESFRPTAYKDGKYPSIGFGLNLTPIHKEWGARILGMKKFPKRITWEQGKKLLRAYINERLAPEFPDNGLLTPQQRVAKIVHAYNRGTGSANNIHNCCGGYKGCGSRDRDVRSAHTTRRIWEGIAWRGGLTPQMIEKDRLKAEERRAAFQ